MITRLELQQYRRMTDHHRRAPEARAFRRKLEAALAGLPRELQRLVVLRYCLRLSWRAVATKMNYSERQIYRMGKRALNALEKQE